MELKSLYIYSHSSTDVYFSMQCRYIFFHPFYVCVLSLRHIPYLQLTERQSIDNKAISIIQKSSRNSKDDLRQLDQTRYPCSLVSKEIQTDVLHKISTETELKATFKGHAVQFIHYYFCFTYCI